MINWKWPKTDNNNLNAWYEILWRIFPCSVLYYLGIAITYSGILLADGKYAANDYWNFNV